MTTLPHYLVRIPNQFGGSAFYFSRRPTKTECEWLRVGYDGDTITVAPCEPVDFPQDAVLADIRRNIRQSAARKSATR